MMVLLPLGNHWISHRAVHGARNVADARTNLGLGTGQAVTFNGLTTTGSGMFARGASSIGATITSQSLDPVTSDVVGQAEFRSDNAGTVQIINRAVKRCN